MDKYVNSEVNQHLMKLLLMGANVQVVPGKMVYVKFHLLEDFEVSYVYNVNKKGKYFLERIKPYPVSIKEFETPEDIVETISLDYSQFVNATNSKKIQSFVDINMDLHKLIKSFEDLFLYYNVNEDIIDSFKSKINEMKKEIKSSSKVCNRVFFDKNPDNL